MYFQVNNQYNIPIMKGKSFSGFKSEGKIVAVMLLIEVVLKFSECK